MSEAPATSYDEVPYGANVFYYAHPDRMATMAMLLGMRPPPVESCRVLELGCGTGANLLGMALTLPRSRFVGIDLSPRQIEMGQEVVGALGLANIELKAMSLMDVDERFGEFDYIICHGVYSWVPKPVQDQILTTCARNLAPDGVAYVSYNTYPGWHMRGMVREMMRFHVRQFDEPAVKVEQARALLAFLQEAAGDRKGAYGELLQMESAMLQDVGNDYIYHEHLEDDNHPVYFHQFAERIAASGLQHLAEARPTVLPANISPKVKATLEELSVDLVHAEQYLDFVRNRTFRRSLLCHAGVALKRPPAPETVMSLYVTGHVKPVSERPDLGAAAAEEFRASDGTGLIARDPLLKAALVCLFDVWPQAVSFPALSAMIQERLGKIPESVSATEESDPLPLADRLLQCFLSTFVELQVVPSCFTTEPGERPQASPLARLQAEQSARVTNLRHRMVELNDLERVLLPLLDGSRNRDTVMAGLVEATGRGDLELTHNGEPLRDQEQVHAFLGEALEASLRSLGRKALLLS